MVYISSVVQKADTVHLLAGINYSPCELDLLGEGSREIMTVGLTDYRDGRLRVYHQAIKGYFDRRGHDIFSHVMPLT